MRGSTDVVILIVLLAASCAIGAVSDNVIWRHWAVKVNAAHYDQQTGAWTEGPAVTSQKTGEVPHAD